MNHMSNAEYQACIATLGILQADIVRMESKLYSKEYRDRRNAADAKYMAIAIFGALAIAFGLIPLALIAPFFVAYNLVVWMSRGVGIAGFWVSAIVLWLLVPKGARFVKRLCECRAAIIQAAFERRMCGEPGYSARPTTQCPRCLTPFSSDAAYCTACGKAA